MSSFSPISASLSQSMQMDKIVAGNMEAAKKAQDLARVNEAAAEFESVFVSEMLKPMFEGISTEAPFGGGKGEEVFRAMMVQEYGKIIARTGGIGLSDPIKTEMIRMQEQADNAK